MADALLDDLDDLSDVQEENEENYEGKEEVATDPAYDDDADGNADFGDNAAISSLDSHVLGNSDDAAASNSQPRPRFLDDPSLQRHLSLIQSEQDASNNSNDDSNSNNNTNNIRDQDRHQNNLILQSNRHLLSLTHEIQRAHLHLRKLYHPKFPELEELLTDPFQYRQAVGILRNEMDVTLVNDRLNDVLTSNQIITISVAGSTTSGRPLTAAELSRVDDACLYLDRLQRTQTVLRSFVQSQMERWAPSTCALVGPAIASLLLSATGGLAELAKIPACNLQLLGKTKATAASRAGFATQTRVQHAGYLMECDLVAGVPNFLKMRALKAVAGKLALAVRADYVNWESGRERSGEVGRRLYEELKGKFGKWEEVDKGQVVKALPKIVSPQMQRINVLL